MSHIRIGHEILRRLPRKVSQKNDKFVHFLHEKHLLLAFHRVEVQNGRLRVFLGTIDANIRLILMSGHRANALIAEQHKYEVGNHVNGYEEQI